MKSEVHLKILARSTQRSLLNDQLVEELYGEIRNFCFTIGNKNNEIQVLVGNEVMSLEQNMLKVEKRAT
jgi:hypothetical protein